MAQVCYRYDGTFQGFLTCIFESYVNHEPPCAFLTPDRDEMTLWEEREALPPAEFEQLSLFDAKVS